MICLAVNTANLVMSVAIVAADGTVMYRFETGETRDQGNLLLQYIGQGLSATGLGYDDLHLLAVVTGPGSFTGIRIGLAAMRGIALASQKPLIGISSFELFDEHLDGYTNIVAVESFRDELYLKTRDRKPVNMPPEAFVATLDQARYLISGDARQKLAGLLPDAVISDADGHAAKAALLALSRYAETGAGERPEPYYLRDADISVSTKIRKTVIV